MSVLFMCMSIPLCVVCLPLWSTVAAKNAHLSAFAFSLDHSRNFVKMLWSCVMPAGVCECMVRSSAYVALLDCVCVCAKHTPRCVYLLSVRRSGSMQMLKRMGLSGQPCFTPLLMCVGCVCECLSVCMTVCEFVFMCSMSEMSDCGMFSFVSICVIRVCGKLGKALSRSYQIW